MRWSACVIAVSLCACAAQVVTPKAPETAAAEAAQPTPASESPVQTVETKVAVEDALAVAPTPEAQRRLPDESVLGVIDRAGLVLIIDAGLGRLFQRLKVSPAMREGKFVGFRITAIDEAWAASLLQAGDVITSLNGQSIERPEQAMNAFERLRQADELVVDLLREGVPATLRYRIE